MQLHIALSSNTFWQSITSLFCHIPPIPLTCYCVIFLFPQLKQPIEGHYYDDILAIKTAVTEQQHSIPKTAFQTRLKRPAETLATVYQCWGAYFEGN
jgi:hypothetical protein